MPRSPNDFNVTPGLSPSRSGDRQRPWRGKLIWTLLIALGLGAAVRTIYQSYGVPEPSTVTDPAAANETPLSTALQKSAQEDELGNVFPETVVDEIGSRKTIIDESTARQNDLDTESFHDAALAQLNQLRDWLAQPDSIEPTQLEPLVTPDFRCAGLRPSKRRRVFRDDFVEVFRAPDIPLPRGTSDVGVAQGAMILAQSLRHLARPLEGATDIRIKFKIFRVQRNGDSLTTQAYYLASGKTSRGQVQQNARWRCQWIDQTASRAPRLRAVDVRDYEEILANYSDGTLFADCTKSVLGGNESYKQLLPSIAHWMQRFDIAHGLTDQAHHGVSVGDVNGDGLDDIYLCQPGGLPNRLYIQNQDGTATDRSQWAGVDFLDYSGASLLLDINNDGHQDLVLVTSSAVLVMENDGKGRFSRVATLCENRGGMAVAAADYDNDSDLDLYVCRYRRLWHQSVHDELGDHPLPMHDANNGGPNLLLRNDGDWQFTDVTQEVGLDVNNRRFSFAAAWEDYDNDGDMDLYVANDFGRNCMYRNDAGRFVDVAAQAGVEDQAAGMSVTWADYNHDGWMDLYISNMFTGAGGRIAFQRGMQNQENRTTGQTYLRLTRGNSLFENRGDGTFRDVSDSAHVTMGRWAWGSTFVDLNNDGWEDLFVGNGYLTNEDSDDL